MISIYLLCISYTDPEEFVDYAIMFSLHFAEVWPVARASQRFWKLEAEEHRMFLQKCECAQGLLNPFLGLTCREQVQGTEDRLSPLSSSFTRTLTGPNQWSNLDG